MELLLLLEMMEKSLWRYLFGWVGVVVVSVVGVSVVVTSFVRGSHCCIILVHCRLVG